MDAISVPQNVCLTMIVKNESHVIERCVVSAKPFINSWCIVDTGSEDNTPKIIGRALEGVPGELHRREWRNFGSNRSEAIQLAGRVPDYLLFLDADEVLTLPDNYLRPHLDADAYSLLLKHGDV